LLSKLLSIKYAKPTAPFPCFVLKGTAKPAWVIYSSLELKGILLSKNLVSVEKVLKPKPKESSVFPIKDSPAGLYAKAAKSSLIP